MKNSPFWFRALFLILYFPLSLPLSAQVVAVAKPTLKYAKKQIWSITLTNSSASPITVSRESIMQKFLPIAEYPNDIAQDTLLAAASRSPHSWAGTLWSILMPLGQTAAEGTALATRKNGPIYIAGALSVTGMAVQLFSSRAVTPQKYFHEILPEGQITLAAGSAGGATYNVVSDLVPSAQALGPFIIPVVIPAVTAAVTHSPAQTADVPYVNTKYLEQIMTSHREAARLFIEAYRPHVH